MFFIMAFMSVNVGINEDDRYQNEYAQALYKYYSSFGKDTTALYYAPEKGSMHLYGGFFDFTATVVNAALGTNDPGIEAYHSVRHVWNSIMGFLAILFTALLARYIGGWYMGFLALFLMFFSPRFLGDSMMNPKDIPFAAGYIMAVYYTAVFLKEMEKPKRSTIIGLAIGLGLAISTRVGGLLLLGYMGMFVGIELWRHYGLSSALGNTKRLFNIAKYALLAVLAGYILAVLFWPYALIDPIRHPFEALSEMSKRGVNIKLLFMGGLIWAQSCPWYYSFVWMYFTIPIAVLLGLLLFIPFIGKILKDYSISPLHLVFFSCAFPIFYVIYKESTLYDGWRHLYFAYPSMVVLASLGWFGLMRSLPAKKVFSYGMSGLIAIILLEPAIFIVRNPHVPYVYFNPLIGGVNGAFGKFELDYWGTSIKQGMEYLDKQDVFKNATEENPITVATNSNYVAMAYAGKFGKKIKLIYTKYYNRDDQKWDYAMFISRFVAPEQQKIRKWPVASYAIHNIKANNTPVLTIYRDSLHYSYDAQQAMKAKDFPKAIELLEKEIAIHPDNELAQLRLGQAYLSTAKFDMAATVLETALALVPDWDNGLYMKAIGLQNQNKLDEAEQLHLKVLELNGRYSPSIQQLAAIYSTQAKHAFALQYVEELVQMEGHRKEIIQFAAEIHKRAGSHKADAYEKYLQKMQ
jgi:tetratricopeptide (TPR) repeat protein